MSASWEATCGRLVDRSWEASLVLEVEQYEALSVAGQ